MIYPLKMVIFPLKMLIFQFVLLVRYVYPNLLLVKAPIVGELSREVNEPSVQYDQQPDGV